MIPRVASKVIQEWLKSGKAIVVKGARQTGKTTLLKHISSDLTQPLWLDCDDPMVRMNLENAGIETIGHIIGIHQCVIIDEIQRVKNGGLTLKLITDHFPNVQLLVTGSSTLNLSYNLAESLTGRKRELILHPISWSELKAHYGLLSASGQLEQRIIYGMYPEVVTHPGQEKEILKELVSSYLYKDILGLIGIRKPEILDRLLRAIALQIGQEVSYNELSRLIEVDKKTIVNYIDLLEKSFIVFRLVPFARNLRNEISTKRKIYFYDTGIRNALLSAYQPLSLRVDTGQLWENFIICERFKKIEYDRIFCNSYFWRTLQQQEIDYIEELNGEFSLYEFKWNPAREHYRFSTTFQTQYPVHQKIVVTPQNMDDFLS